MVTVRFPNGQAITYNQATTIQAMPDANYVKISGPGDKLFACVQNSAGAVFEWNAPCKIENSVTRISLSNSLDMVLSGLREFKDWRELGKLADLKCKLRKFNQQHRRWMR